MVEEEGGVRTVHEQSVFGNIRDMQRLPWNPALRSLPHDAQEVGGQTLATHRVLHDAHQSEVDRHAHGCPVPPSVKRQQGSVVIPLTEE